jgi:hypothetical protein
MVERLLGVFEVESEVFTVEGENEVIEDVTAQEHIFSG